MSRNVKHLSVLAATFHRPPPEAPHARVETTGLAGPGDDVEVEADRPDFDPETVRPRSRQDCVDGVNAGRPCPWLSCMWHVSGDAETTTRLAKSLKTAGLPFTDCRWDIEDWAEKGEHIPDSVIAAVVRTSGEHARRIATTVFERLRPRYRFDLGLDDLAPKAAK